MRGELHLITEEDLPDDGGYGWLEDALERMFDGIEQRLQAEVEMDLIDRSRGLR